LGRIFYASRVRKLALPALGGNQGKEIFVADIVDWAHIAIG